MSMRWRALGSGLILAGLVAVAAAQPGGTAKERSRRVESSGVEFVTPATQRAIDRGLKALAEAQQDDGSWGRNGTYRQNAAVTALAGLAFLSAGNVPGQGKYGANVEKATAFLLEIMEPNGFLHAPDVQIHGPMYEHGFATLFLAEVYGMSPSEKLREKLKLAVDLIVASQNREGGWRYQAVPRDADVSVTVCQIMALRAARNAGLYVPKDTVEDCIEYVKRCQNSDGGFRYQLTTLSPSVFARSAAGLVALYSAGIYEGKEVDRGLRHLTQYLPRGEFFRPEPHYFYGHYYAVQAMFLAGGEHWAVWWPAIRSLLLQTQDANGKWEDSSAGEEYGTAMALIILQMPKRYLPIFQK
jgi:hypothetical protein